MLSGLAVLLLAQGAAGLDPRRSYAAGDKDAVLMLPPTTVCDGDVQDMVWTADGSALVVRRAVTNASASDIASVASGKPPTPELIAKMAPKVELIVWSAKTHKSKTVLSADARTLRLAPMEPMVGTDRLVFGADERVVGADGQTRNVSSYQVLSAGTGTLTRLGSFEATQTYVGVSLSPKQPLGLVSAVDATTKAHTARFFGPTGRLGNALALPPRSQLVFDRTGAPILSLGYDKQGKKVTFHYQKVNVASGTLGDRYDGTIDEEFDFSPPDTAWKAVPVSGTADGVRAPSVLLKLSGGKPTEAGVVTTDGERALVSPKNDAVAYVSQGSAVVRPLARVSRQEYESAMLAAQKAIAMSNAKQVALGLIMFSADMDDVLPSQGDYTKVAPYLKDSNLMNSFTYTFAGGDVTKIDKPAETEIGYVPGPGGRAVAYADGHVKWVPNTP